MTGEHHATGNAAGSPGRSPARSINFSAPGCARATDHRLALLGSAAALLVAITGCTAHVAATRPPNSSANQPPIRSGNSTDPVIGAAGDIACPAGKPASDKRCDQGGTAALLEAANVAAVLPLGDDQYECGTLSDFQQSYASTWGKLLRVTHPAIGNHEYGRICHRNSASAYFDYFGASAGPTNHGWYSYDVGSWHLIALNSECSYGKGATAVGGCGPGSPQAQWLAGDLASDHATCTLAYWHEPRFSSGEHGDAEQMSYLWNMLVANHVDVVLSGHNHDYERFDPIGNTPAQSGDRDATTTGQPVFQDPVPDPHGIREFVVGTGGKNHYSFQHPALSGEVVRNGDTFGVLLLTLHADSYDWRFEPVTADGFTDSGSGVCH